jgi:exosortase K
MKTRLFWCALVLLTVWALKRYYSKAPVDDLAWMLSPVSRLAGAVTGATFEPEPGNGYLSRDRLFVIGKSCAGLNFMIAAFAMLMFVLRHHLGTLPTGAAVFAGSLAAAYGTAVVVNATRIAVAMWLRAEAPAWSAPQIHRLEGIIIYFTGLVLLYELARRWPKAAPSRIHA